MSSDISDIIKERGKRYGSYVTHSVKLEMLNDTLANMENYANTTPIVRCGARMILDKLVRAFNGDWRYLDNWVDIEGYAKLVRTYLETTYELKEVPIEYLRDKCCDEWELRGSMSSKYKRSCWNCKFRNEFFNDCDLDKDVLPRNDYRPKPNEIDEHICDKYLWDDKYKERDDKASCRICTYFDNCSGRCLLSNFKNWKLIPETANELVAKVAIKKPSGLYALKDKFSEQAQLIQSYIVAVLKEYPDVITTDLENAIDDRFPVLFEVLAANNNSLPECDMSTLEELVVGVVLASDGFIHKFDCHSFIRDLTLRYFNTCKRYIANPVYGVDDKTCEHCTHWNRACMYGKCQHYEDYYNKCITATTSSIRCEYGDCVGCISCEVLNG